MLFLYIFFNQNMNTKNNTQNNSNNISKGVLLEKMFKNIESHSLFSSRLKENGNCVIHFELEVVHTTLF